jgi:putative membrane protein
MEYRQRWTAAIVVPFFSALAAFAIAAPAVPQGDRDFARKAAAAGMDEIAGGKLARERAEDEAVRRFGERMADDHGKANERLRAIAASEGIPVPGKLDKSGEKDVDRLTKLKGHDFDVAYMKHNLAAHKTAIKEFKKEARSGHDAQLKRFAEETLPTLEEHMQLAQSASKEIGVPTPKSK